MKSQVIELQADNKHMNEMNTMTTKTNHYQELIKTMEKEKGMKQILVTDNTAMKIEIQKLTSEIQRQQSGQKERSKETERLKTEITKMKSELEKYKKQVSTEQNNDKKKLTEISNEKTNLEKQVTTLKYLKIQLEKQIMSSKEQTEKENNTGIVIGQQDETPGKVRNRQAVTGKEKQMGEAIYRECIGKTINEGKLRELINQDGGLRKLEIRKSKVGKEGNVGITYSETKDQAIKTVETLNKSKQYVAKQYKLNDKNGPREQKQQSETLLNHRKQEDQWIEHQRGETKRIELQAKAEKSSKSDTNNRKKCHASDSSAHMIKTCTKQRHIFATYKLKRKLTERDIIDIMEEYGTIERLKVYNNIHTNNNKALICFETKEEAQRAIADINRYPGWKASLYYCRHKIQENREEGKSDKNNLTEEKNSKKIPNLSSKA